MTGMRNSSEQNIYEASEQSPPNKQKVETKPEASGQDQFKVIQFRRTLEGLFLSQNATLTMGFGDFSGGKTGVFLILTYQVKLPLNGSLEAPGVLQHEKFVTFRFLDRARSSISFL